MSSLHYQVWTRTAAGELDEIVASGTFAVTTSMSAPVALPVPLPGQVGPQIGRSFATLMRVIGSDNVYVEARAAGGGTPSSTTAHAATDAAPRQLLLASDGMVLVKMPAGGSFGAVQAAALS